MEQIVRELRAVSDELRAGRGDELRAASDELRAEVGEELSAGVGLGAGSYAAASPYDHLAFRRLHYREGSSDKFWEAATDENKLVVRWGKRGSKGQIQLKTFPDSEAAQKEMERSIREKLGAGYEG
jgi:predicted DNA-binding WGR domain protein